MLAPFVVGAPVGALVVPPGPPAVVVPGSDVIAAVVLAVSLVVGVVAAVVGRLVVLTGARVVRAASQ